MSKEMKETTEDIIKNPKDMSIRMLEFLLAQKDKSVSYAKVAALVTEAVKGFEEEFDKPETKTPFTKEKLEGKSPEFIFHLLTFSVYVKIISYLLYDCSPEEAESISKLLKKPESNV
jgi:hypothetical protein